LCTIALTVVGDVTEVALVTLHKTLECRHLRVWQAGTPRLCNLVDNRQLHFVCNIFQRVRGNCGERRGKAVWREEAEAFTVQSTLSLSWVVVCRSHRDPGVWELPALLDTQDKRASDRSEDASRSASSSSPGSTSRAYQRAVPRQDP
jgi:hypothetical protein